MFYLYTNKKNFDYEISEEIRLFLMCDKIEMVEKDFALPSGVNLFLLHEVTEINIDQYQSRVWLHGSDNNCHTHDFVINEGDNDIEKKRTLKFAIKLSVYNFLKDYTNQKMPWGVLTGIRPTKMLRDLIQRRGADDALQYMRETLDLSDEKLELAYDIVKRQDKVMASIDNRSADIYIHIPFCPSICHYCSFSSTQAKNKTLQKKYLSCLKEEILGLKDIISKYDIRSIYIGGGTPTSLSFDVLEDLLSFINDNLKKPIEYTVEAGRPDTLSVQVLRLLRKSGVDRISVNTQTLKQKTLNSIGRNHTIKQFFDAFKNARNTSFYNINVDLIFGLPNESLFDMKRTLNRIIKLNPESITIHTLSIKNSAKFERDVKYKSNEKIVERAVLWANRRCVKANIKPYYMYRQKYMKGNLENVGYAKEGFESIYNIDMMEEVCSILSFGAGAVSKHVHFGENRLNRCYNVKDVNMYIERLPLMIKRKKDLFNMD